MKYDWKIFADKAMSALVIAWCALLTKYMAIRPNSSDAWADFWWEFGMATLVALCVALNGDYKSFSAFKSYAARKLVKPIQTGGNNDSKS